MNTVPAAASVPVVPSALPPPPDTSPPVVYANGPITAIRLIASMTPFVGQRLDTQA